MLAHGGEVLWSTRLLLTVFSLGMLATALWISDDRVLPRAVKLYSLQSGFLAACFLTLGLTVRSYFLYWAASSVVTKVVGVPLLLLWVLRKTGVFEEEKPFIGSTATWVLAILLAFIGFIVALKIPGKPYIPLSISFSLFGVGLLQVCSRRNSVKQVLGLCHFENGSHLTLALLAPGIPETIEVGIATDAILLVFFGCIVSLYMHHLMGSLDTSRLRALREVG